MQAALIQTQSLPPIARGLMAVTLLVMRWELRHRSRKGLRGMDMHILNDVGLSSREAQQEATKPFWRP